VSQGINERVAVRPAAYASSPAGARPPERPALLSPQARELLNLRRLPAILNVAQTAVLLNRGEHDIPLLVRAGIIKPLGGPPPNGVKYFATRDILELAEDRDALDRMCAIVTRHWHDKNVAKAAKGRG
jgi:hypothetical protein